MRTFFNYQCSKGEAFSGNTKASGWKIRKVGCRFCWTYEVWFEQCDCIATEENTGAPAPGLYEHRNGEGEN